MSGVDLDKVLQTLSEEGGGLKDNSDSLIGLAKEVNKVLTEFEKTVKMLENMHVLPVAIRLVGKKYDIDVDSPLASGSDIQPATDYHKVVFEKLNEMTQEQIGEALLNGSKKATSAGDTNKKSDAKND